MSFRNYAPKQWIAYGSVIEYNHTTSNHPLHLYHYPMQVVGTCSGHTTGEYYDTIITTDGGNNCRVRFTATFQFGKTFIGDTTWSNWDLGAFAWLYVYIPRVFNNPPILQQSTLTRRRNLQEVFSSDNLIN